MEEVINTAHGYTKKSVGFQNFIQFLATLDRKLRQPLIQFLTGCPRLPLGGFGALEPRLTVVQKRPESHQKNLSVDDILPSVMTCQNYLKLPEYTTFEILKQKFTVAIEEGCSHFGLA